MAGSGCVRGTWTTRCTKMPGVTIASVHEVVPLGALDPEHVVTPGIFVQRIVRVARTATGPAGFKQAA